MTGSLVAILIIHKSVFIIWCCVNLLLYKIICYHKKYMPTCYRYIK